MTWPSDDGAQAVQWDNLRPWGRQAFGANVGRTERWISGVAGAALLVSALRRKRLRVVLLPLGFGLIRRAVTGRCEINRALGRNSAEGERGVSRVASLERGEGAKVERSVVINRPCEELFQFWRQFDNLPRFMDNLESVTILDAHCLAQPAGRRRRPGGVGLLLAPGRRGDRGPGDHALLGTGRPSRRCRRSHPRQRSGPADRGRSAPVQAGDGHGRARVLGAGCGTFLTAYDCDTVELRSAEVVEAARDAEGFDLRCADGSRLRSRKLLLATGCSRPSCGLRTGAPPPAVPASAVHRRRSVA